MENKNIENSENIPEAKKPVSEASLANLKDKWKPGQSGNPAGRPKGIKNEIKRISVKFEPPFAVVAGKTAQEVLENNQTNIAYWLLKEAFLGDAKLKAILANKVFADLGGLASESSKRIFRELTRMSKKDMERLLGESDIDVVSIDGEIVVKEPKEVKANPNRPKNTGDVS